MNRRNFFTTMGAAVTGALLGHKVEAVPLEYIELTAKTHAGKVRVWLDDEEVSDWAFYAYVPAHPGVVAHGTVGMHTQRPAVRDPLTGVAVEEYKSGNVYWLPTNS